MFSSNKSVVRMTSINVLVATIMTTMVALNGATTTIDFSKTEEVVFATPQQFSTSVTITTTTTNTSPPTSLAANNTLSSESMPTPIFLVSPTAFQKRILDVDIVFSEETDSQTSTIGGVAIAGLVMVSIAIALLLLLIALSRRRHKKSSQILFDSFV